MAEELKSRLTKAKDLTDPDGNTVGGLSDLQQQFDYSEDQGYRGIKVDPLPNKLYSQETDPTMSPGHDRQRLTEWDPFRDPEDPTTPTGRLITSHDGSDQAAEGSDEPASTPTPRRRASQESE